jgi:hypothetical protein
MKRVTLMAFVVCAVLLILPASAYASDNAESKSNVTITVVMPDTVQQPEEITESEPDEVTPVSVLVPEFSLYPTSVEETRENGSRRIIKVYELGALENPSDIPRGSFVREDWEYELTDITKTETATADAKDHIEKVELNTDTKELETIIKQLQPVIEYTSEDGYAGFLSLNIASIKVEQAGTETSSYTVTAKREYPHLSTNDTSLLPKTITDGGKTYTLANVDWQAGNTVAVDYEAMPEYYTAYATYTASASKTVVTGYITTAEYVGTVSKIGQGKTIYTAYFLGTEIVPERIPLEIVEPAATKPNKPGKTEAPEPTPETAAMSNLPVTQELSSLPEPTENTAPELIETAEPERTRETESLLNTVLTLLCALLIGGGAGYLLTKPQNTSKRKDE